MAVPQSNINPNITIESMPSLTWYIDSETQTIQGKTDGIIAVQQAVDTILQTLRFRWGIYTPNLGTDYADLIGQPIGFVAAELYRRISEALLVDDRIISVDNFNYTANGDTLTATLDVQTVFGTIPQQVEVNLN